MKYVQILILFALITSGFKADDRQTIYLCGDSTMANKLAIDAPETGWGMVFSTYFFDGIKVENHAVNGRSSKSFRTLGHWKKVHEQLKPGDWVVLQFGHNDQKESDTTRFATPADYRKNLEKYIAEIQAKGASTILMTPVARRNFKEGIFVENQHGEYPQVVRDLAKKLNLPMIDMLEKSGQIIKKQGDEGSKMLFLQAESGIYKKYPKGIKDDTHFSYYGAELMATAAVEGILETNLPLKNFLKKSNFPEKFEFELPKFITPVFRKDTFLITRYGAISDGVFNNSVAINQAIEQCNQAGGGTVVVPAGFWLTGPIVLKAKVNFHVAKGAVLQFSQNMADYPIILTTWEGEEAYRCQAPISAKGVSNIGLTGDGIIDGGGDAWRAVKKSKQTDSEWERLLAKGGFLNEAKDMWYPIESALKGSLQNRPGKKTDGKYATMAELENIKGFLRPNMISLVSCKYLTINGLTIQNSPAWSIHPMLCQHLSVKNVQVRNPWFAQNSDAIDLESCQNGTIDNCTFDTGDDGITIKSGRDEEGRKRGVPTENFIIRNTTVFHAHGGFVIGSEMSGGVRNMFVENCTFSGTDVGLRFKTTRGRGGVVEDIFVSNIQMNNILGEAIIFDMYYSAKDPVALKGEAAELPIIASKPVDITTPQFRNFFIHNVNCSGAETAILLRGVPEMPISNILIDNAVIQSNKGLLAVEAENIQLKNCQIYAKDKVLGTLQNCKKLTIDHLIYQQNMPQFLKIEGMNSKEISVLNTSYSAEKIEFGKGVNKTILRNK